jgi:hypothetical protein
LSAVLADLSVVPVDVCAAIGAADIRTVQSPT